MKRLQIALWILIIVLFSVAVRAGELRLNWEEPTSGPVATGYRVYAGDTDPPTGFVELGLVYEHNLIGLPDCATGYYSVQAFNSAGQSEMHPTISVYPRPSVSDLTASEGGVHTIHGENFDTNLKVWVDAGAGFVQVGASQVNRVDCDTITIPDQPLNRIQVANVAMPLGSGEPLNIFSLPWPAPTGVTIE